MRVTWRIVAATLATSACGPSSASSVGSAHSAANGDAPSAAPSSAPRAQATCPAEPTFSPTGDYKHKRTRLVVQSQGSPRHSASDVAVAAGKAAIVRGKFTYGKAGKDLEDEEISLFVRDESCTWRSIDTAFTNSDGWVALEVPESLISKPGRYAFQLVVRGDGSRASGTVFAVEKGTRAVVFDVDATLTIGDEEIAREVIEDKVPEAQPHGNEVARAWTAQGLLPLYLTGRPYMLGPTTRAWLASHGFPEGLVRTTESVEACLPTPEGVGAYKKAALEDFKNAGLDLAIAYGNATTDICAYASAGIDPKRTFIVGPYAGQGCDGKGTTVALPGYADHAKQLPTL
jgi:phosphatidate phosphatase PAH1